MIKVWCTRCHGTFLADDKWGGFSTVVHEGEACPKCGADAFDWPWVPCDKDYDPEMDDV